MSKEARRDTRYRCELPITLIARSGNVRLLTDNVSYRGFFLRTDSPPPRMQLLQVQFTLPGHETPITTHAMVVYVTGSDAAMRGAGVCFFAMDAGIRKDWEAFIVATRERLDAQPKPPPAPTVRARDKRSLVPGVLSAARRSLAPAPQITISTSF
ncbi:MAG TPA: PilZ domain-containing protein [Polyangiaceae bacterium]|jgi:hypothetical protein